MRHAREPALMVCGPCGKEFTGNATDPCPRCGGHGLDHKGVPKPVQEWFWLLESWTTDGELIPTWKTCNSLDECQFWVADIQVRYNLWKAHAICVQTGEVVEMKVIRP